MSKICHVDNCNRQVGRHGARGMCPYHYKRNRAGIPFDQPKQGTFSRRCSFDDCNSTHYGKGFCQTHYWRSKSIGGLDASIRIPRRSIYNDGGEYSLIPLGVNAKQGYAIVDNDFRYLDKHQWSLGVRGYAVTNINRKNKYLHHLVLQPENGFVINHKNENKLDNRSDNLELVDRRSNNTFKSTHRVGNTGVRGVFLDPRSLNKPYTAQISWDGTKRKKYFSTLNEATEKRREWELELFGREVH